MADLIQAHDSLAAILDTAQRSWPAIATYDEKTRIFFARGVRLYQEWISLPKDRRRPVVLQAALALQMSQQRVLAMFRHLYRTQDYTILLPKPRADRGRARAWDAPALEFLKARYFDLHSKQRAYQDTVETCKTMGLRVGSYRSACVHVREWERDANTKAMIAMNHKTKDYSDAYEVPFLRDKSDLRPLEVICGDHHQFDVVILWPNGEIIRPWVSAWVDVRTGRWLGLTVCKSPDARSIADSLYWTIKRLGIPENIYIDNGKAYRAKILKGTVFNEEELGRIDIPPDAAELLAALQDGLYGSSRRVHALPFNARAKVVERFFGIGGFSDWCKGLPGWTGRRYDEMPDETRKRIKSRQLLGFDDFMLRLIKEVARMNARPSRAHGMGGSSPNEVLKWYIERGWRPRRPSNEHLIDLMAMHTATRKVRAYGIQHSSSKDDPMFYFNEALGRYVGQDVMVKWSAADMQPRKLFSRETEDGYTYRAVPTELLVYTLPKRQGEISHFICSATPVIRRQYLDDPGIGEALKKRNAKRKELRKQLTEYKEFEDYVQLPPAVAGEPDIIEPKKLKLVKTPGLTSGMAEVHEEVKRKREQKGRYRDILHRQRPDNDYDEEIVL